eukprot:1703432-Rhodomonas_salina.1
MALDLAEAVTFLHAQQPPILHLDIKTPNLLVASGACLWRGLSPSTQRVLLYAMCGTALAYAAMTCA